MLELGKMEFEERRIAVKRIKDNAKELVAAYEETWNKTPDDMLECLVGKIGREACLDAVANLVNAIGEWDGRVSRSHRNWAMNREGAVSRDELRNICWYFPDAEIHPVHIDQIAEAAIKAERRWMADNIDSPRTDSIKNPDPKTRRKGR